MKLLKVSNMVVCVVTGVLCLSCHKCAIRITAMLIVQLAFQHAQFLIDLLWHRSNACKLTRRSHIGKGAFAKCELLLICIAACAFADHSNHCCLSCVQSPHDASMNAGSGDGVWETAEPPSAGNAWEQPKQGRKSRQEPAPEAGPLPAPAVAAPNADLAIPAAELAEILHEELEDNFCCPLTLVCSHMHHSLATKPLSLCPIACACPTAALGASAVHNLA